MTLFLYASNYALFPIINSFHYERTGLASQEFVCGAFIVVRDFRRRRPITVRAR